MVGRVTSYILGQVKTGGSVATMTGDRSRVPDKPATSGEVAAFLRQLAATPAVRPAPGQRGRLLFALDATASRQPTWDRACQIQAEMFNETAALGGLDVQLAFYRGFWEFEASAWLDSAGDLLQRMTAVTCLGGKTQIGSVLKHAIAETKRKKSMPSSLWATAWRKTSMSSATRQAS